MSSKIAAKKDLAEPIRGRHMPLRGTLEQVSHRNVLGWAWDSDEPDQHVSVLVSCNGQVLDRVIADQYRSDLEQAGIGNGRHGFEITLTSPLSLLMRHSITACREDDGRGLGASPCVLEPVAVLDPSTRDIIARILSTFTDEADFSQKLAFLTATADRLRQVHAAERSGANAHRGDVVRGWSKPDGERVAGEAGTTRLRALVVDDRIPLPHHDAGSNALLSHMRALQRLGYDVTFAPAHLRGDAAVLAAEGIACCLHPWYACIEDVLQRHHGAFDVVYLHRVSTAACYVALARHHQPGARIVYSVADLHHLRMARQAEVEGRLDLARRSEELRLAELATAWLSDAVITHSTVEATLLQEHVAPEKIHVVPWSLTPCATQVPFTQRRGFAFIGGYGHQPNVDAALWLVDSVMPRIEASGSTIPCMLAGSDMPEILRTLRRHDVDPVGHVPVLSSLFDRVRLTVAPLTFGAGVKGKVLDSLAAGVPCVCTPIAAEGLDLPDILLQQVGSTPAELARLIRGLHDDEALNQACAEAGLAYVAARMNAERIELLLSGALDLPSALPRQDDGGQLP